MIVIAVVLSLLSNFGSLIAIIEPFTFTKISISNQGFLSFSSAEQTYLIENQWWRLITPMFLHFSFAHLAFNCLWIYVLGEKIERVDGKLIFTLIIILTAVFSNLLQYFWTSSSLFGGLSGVIYGMLGYCLVMEMESNYDKYGLPPGLYLFMIAWLILGFLGILDLFGFGSVANFAHLGGMLSGLMFAMIYKTLNRRI
ncbi:MAG: rhomboid family intramembrane serine protease [Pseudomonadota bacterium]|nr:rhomboid family intramembrane serine protease [Pseudomonadota bacterium]